jgi:hypothetical protein
VDPSDTLLQVILLNPISAGRSVRKRLNIALSEDATGRDVIVVIDPAVLIPENAKDNNTVVGGPL